MPPTFDRFVIRARFASAGYDVRYVSQVVADASGQPVSLLGTKRIHVVLRHARGHTSAGPPPAAEREDAAVLQPAPGQEGGASPEPEGDDALEARPAFLTWRRLEHSGVFTLGRRFAPADVCPPRVTQDDVDALGAEQRHRVARASATIRVT